MRIAVCDDEQAQRAAVCAQLHAWRPAYTVESFAEGEGLLQRIRQGARYDLLLLDIALPGKDGISVGEQIRAYDEDVLLLFLTSHEQYVFSSFACGVFDYIMKSAAQERLFAALDRAERLVHKRRHCLTIQTKEGVRRVEVQDLVFVEAYHRHLLLHMRGQTCDTLGKMNALAAQLQPFGFLRCHQGFLVNMQYIQRIEEGIIVTAYGDRVEMSVRKRTECLRLFNEYLEGVSI